MPTGIEGYIIDYEFRKNLGAGGRSHIKFLYYDDIENSADAVYEEQVVRGRTEEHIFYSHTTRDTYRFSIQLAASVDQADDGNAKKTFNDWLFIKSLQYADYGPANRGPVKPPHRVIISIGRWFKKMGIIKTPAATFSKVCDENGYPLFITVRFEFGVINPKPLGLFDVRGGL